MRLAALPIVIFALACVGPVASGPVASGPIAYTSPPDPSMSMSIAEARLRVAEAIEHSWRATGVGWLYGWSFTRNVRDQQPLRIEKLTAKVFELRDVGRFSANGKDYGPYERRLRFDLATLPPLSVMPARKVAYDQPTLQGEIPIFVVIVPGETKNTTPLKWRDLADAAAFVEAMNRLATAAKAPPSRDDDDFAAKAEAWRAMSPKPPLPEDARRQRVLAENAFQEGNREKAFSHFEAALAIEPFWPEGNFNAALLAGELGFYEDAIRYMKRYLVLVPDSKDANAARDKLIVWEDKLQSE